MSTCEEELRGVSIHIELVVGGNDLEAVINDILTENGGPSFFVGVVEPTDPWVYPRHGSSRGRGVHLLMFFIF